MQSTTLSAGDPIEARCTKCRMNNTHTVVTLEDEAPAKVACSRCGRQHKYRPPTVPKTAAPKRTVDPHKAARQEWAALREGMASETATDYSMTATYKVKALMNHPAFGLGLVQRVVGPQKVEVLFEDGKKTMRCK